METAIFKTTLSEAIKKLSEILINQGFLIREVEGHNKILVAYQKGNLISTPRHILFELSSVNTNLTRMDFTISVESKMESCESGEVIEEKIVSIMYTKFNQVHHELRRA